MAPRPRASPRTNDALDRGRREQKRAADRAGLDPKLLGMNQLSYPRGGHAERARDISRFHEDGRRIVHVTIVHAQPQKGQRGVLY